jgi:hypothetical protein
MIKTLTIIFLSICCLSFAVYVLFVAICCLMLLIIKIRELIKEWRNKHGKIL